MQSPEAVDIDLDPERFEGEILQRLKDAIQEGLNSGPAQPARSAEEIIRRGRERLAAMRGA